MSFFRTFEPKTAGDMSPDGLGAARLPVLLASASARQAAGPTARALASILRGQDRSGDMVQALTRIFAGGQDGAIDAGCLSGSFHPGVAAMMTVGTVR